MATLITKTFNLGDLPIVSEFQYLIFMMGNTVGIQADVVLELRMLHIAGNSKSIESHTEGRLSKRDLKAHSHSNTLPPTRSYFLIVQLPLEVTIIQTITPTIDFNFPHSKLKNTNSCTK